LRYLKTDAVARIAPNGTVADRDPPAPKQVDAAAPATIQVLSLARRAINGQSFNQDVFDIPAAHHRKCQAGRGLERDEVIDVQRSRETERLFADLSGERRRGYREAAGVVIVADRDAVTDAEPRGVCHRDFAFVAITVGRQPSLD